MPLNEKLRQKPLDSGGQGTYGAVLLGNLLSLFDCSKLWAFREPASTTEAVCLTGRRQGALALSLWSLTGDC